MTAPDQRHRAAAPDDVAVLAGTVAARWCPVCKANTVLAGDVLIVTPGGVARAGGWQWCEICDDPSYTEQEK